MSSSIASTRGVRSICLVLIVVGLLAAGYGLTSRIQAERSSRAVDIVVEYPEVEALATARGLAVDTVLVRLRDAGVTTVALPEETLTTLADEGQVTLSGQIGWTALGGRSGAIPVWDPSDPIFTAIAVNADAKRQILEGLQRVYAKENLFVYPSASTSTIVMIRGSRQTIGELGLGLSPAKVTRVTRAGLRVAPRLRNIPHATPAALRASLAAAAELLPPAQEGHPRGLVVFDGTTIPGYRDLLPIMAEELGKQGLVYGCIEFGKQKGDASLGGKLDGQLVRVHSISSEELATMSTAQAVQRFSLAVKDRNIRALYIRFPVLTGDDPLANAEQYVTTIRQEITGMRGMGFSVSAATPAHPFQPTTIPAWLLAVLFAGAGAGLLLWMATVLPAELPRRYVYGGYALLILGLALAVGTAFAAPTLGRILFGLLAAIGFPLLALTWAYHQVQRVIAQPPVRLILPAVRALLITTAITLIGGLIIAAAMGETTYLVKVKQFTGVKVALLIPLLAFALLLITDGAAQAGESFAAYRARCRTRFHAFLGQPLYLWGAVFAAVALAAVGLMLMRSGNDSGVGVSMLELKFRALLDQGMIARPRTKEFLVGFPLFLLAMGAAAQRRRALAMALLLGAAVGQVDVLNTYCHAHTPVLLSLLRTVNGLWMGIIIGVLLLLVFAVHARYTQPAKIEAIE